MTKGTAGLGELGQRFFWIVHPRRIGISLAGCIRRGENYGETFRGNADASSNRSQYA